MFNVVGVSYAEIPLALPLGRMPGTLSDTGVRGDWGRKNKVTSYLKISLCRNGKLKGEILPHPLAYKPCLDLCCFKE